MNERTERQIATALAALTLIATAVAAIPAFMEYAADRPAVFFDVVSLPLLNPQNVDFNRVESLLKANGIPNSRMRLRISNRGSGPASSVRVTARFPGGAHSVQVTPSPDSKPAWVTFTTPPTARPGDKVVAFELEDLGVGPSGRQESPMLRLYRRSRGYRTSNARLSFLA